MSNQYGFDFLRSEHVVDNDEEDENDVRDNNSRHLWADGSVSAMATDEDAQAQAVLAAQHKPDLEKQFDILAFLQAHRGSGCLAPSVIYKATGIDLEVDVTVAEMLQKNPKIRVELVPDPENPSIMVATYSYQAKYSNIRDAASLLAQINRMTNGVSLRDLNDSYPNVDHDLQKLITSGEIIAIANTEDKDKILFPRGDDFLVELDGIVALPSGSSGTNNNGENNNDKTNGGDSSNPIYFVETDCDAQPQIRRGEAIQVGGQWFRVSSAIRDGPLIDQPARAQAPLSVVSLQDLSKRNEQDGYRRKFTAKLIPLDDQLSAAARDNILKAKVARERLWKAIHGTTSSAGAGAGAGTNAASGGAGGAGGGAAVMGGGSGSHRMLSSGVTQQLLGSLAHASNPTTILAATTSSASSSKNKRKAFHSFNSNGPGGSSTSSAASAAASDLVAAASDPALFLYRHARRHGCTKDVRQMYLETRDLVPDADIDLHAMLLQHKLIEPGEPLRRPRLTNTKSSNVDNDGKPKKRRYYERKNQRMTNTHLEGTEIGALLALATEKQKQGQSVGDGGM